DHDLSEVLEQEGILAAPMSCVRLQGPAELVEGHLLVLDVLAEDPAENPSGFLICVFDRAEKGIDFPLVWSGVLQNAGDHASLILGSDRGVLAGAERYVEYASLDHRGDVQQPLSEVGRPDVGDR